MGFEAADGCRQNSENRYGDRHGGQKWIALVRGMFGVVGIFEVLLGGVFHCKFASVLRIELSQGAAPSLSPRGSGRWKPTAAGSTMTD